MYQIFFIYRHNSEYDVFLSSTLACYSSLVRPNIISTLAVEIRCQSSENLLFMSKMLHNTYFCPVLLHDFLENYLVTFKQMP